MRLLLSCLVSCLAVLLPSAAPAQDAPRVLVYAAASVAAPLEPLVEAYRREAGVEIVVSAAASSSLARQIERGAPADIFISANRAWMDHIAERDLIVDSSRTALLGNTLVLIAPADSSATLAVEPGFDLAAALGDGRLAVGDPEHVPAGIYAREALIALDVWDEVKDRLAPARDVVAALAFVARGEAPLGIVYATDAAGHAGVRVVGRIPPQSHEPIVYDAAMIADRDAPAVAAFFDYLRSDAAGAVFEAAGFTFRPLD